MYVCTRWSLTERSFVLSGAAAVQYAAQCNSASSGSAPTIAGTRHARDDVSSDVDECNVFVLVRGDGSNAMLWLTSYADDAKRKRW